VPMTPRSQPGRPRPRRKQRTAGLGRPRGRGPGSAAAGLAVVAGAVLAGCSAAPPGAAGTSPAIGPVRTGAAAAAFGPFPVPAVWNGKDYRSYEMVVKPKAGVKPHNVRFIARQDLVFWLNCIGAGSATLTSSDIRFHWSVPCGSGADPAAVNFSPRAAAVGHAVNVLVTASPGARWEVRVDRAAPPGFTPSPASLPTGR
jgi:hypothetical protein